MPFHIQILNRPLCRSNETKCTVQFDRNGCCALLTVALKTKSRQKLVIFREISHCKISMQGGKPIAAIDSKDARCDEGRIKRLSRQLLDSHCLVSAGVVG